MKDRITLYAIGILMLIILTLSVQIYFLRRNTNAIFDKQENELEQLKEYSIKRIDSIEILLKVKSGEITKKEASFYNNINKIKENSIRYEKIKKDISTNNDADSLERLLTKRYSKR